MQKCRQIHSGPWKDKSEKWMKKLATWLKLSEESRIKNGNVWESTAQ